HVPPRLLLRPHHLLNIIHIIEADPHRLLAAHQGRQPGHQPAAKSPRDPRRSARHRPRPLRRRHPHPPPPPPPRDPPPAPPRPHRPAKIAHRRVRRVHHVRRRVPRIETPAAGHQERRRGDQRHHADEPPDRRRGSRDRPIRFARSVSHSTGLIGQRGRSRPK